MKKKIRDFFLNNWELKLFSLLLSFILWITLIPRVKTFSDKNLTIPLEPHNIPSNMEIVEKPPPTIDVIIRASKSVLEQITSSTVVAKLNLEGATPLQEEYPLDKDMIALPSGAKVVRITPNKVRLKLERIKEVYLKIESNIIGELPPNLKIERIEVIPPEVKVQGPESKVSQEEVITTAPIDISSLESTNVELKPSLILPNPYLRLASDTEVKIKIILVSIEEPVEKNESVEKKSKKTD
ncbi:MAG: CdaR family protein [Candidatus Aminicenantia bacterium]